QRSAVGTVEKVQVVGTEWHLEAPVALFRSDRGDTQPPGPGVRRTVGGHAESVLPDGSRVRNHSVNRRSALRARRSSAASIPATISGGDTLALSSMSKRGSSAHTTASAAGTSGWHWIARAEP